MTATIGRSTICSMGALNPVIAVGVMLAAALVVDFSLEALTDSNLIRHQVFGQGPCCVTSATTNHLPPASRCHTRTYADGFAAGASNVP